MIQEENNIACDLLTSSCIARITSNFCVRTHGEKKVIGVGESEPRKSIRCWHGHSRRIGREGTREKDRGREKKA
jgi:hypothetical protein